MTTTPERLAVGTRAVITGAASGIGRAVSHRLAKQGLDVLAIDRDAEGLSHLADAGIQTMVADLADTAARARVISAGHGCTYLVNAAGLLVVRSVWELTERDWQQVFAINAEAVFFLCQQIGLTMPPGAAIVNISSSSAKLASSTDATIYAASKAAVLSLTRSFAQALATVPVRVNAVCPGIVDTPMQERFLQDAAAVRGMDVDQLRAQREQLVPLARSSSADECAGVITFLLSADASYMTGQAVNVTGGLVTW